jgi:hypothetical protein
MRRVHAGDPACIGAGWWCCEMCDYDRCDACCEMYTRCRRTVGCRRLVGDVHEVRRHVMCMSHDVTRGGRQVDEELKKMRVCWGRG